MAGRNLMPGFGAALSRPKIQHLGGYVRRLGDRRRPKGQPLKPAAGDVAPEPVARPQGPGDREPPWQPAEPALPRGCAR